MIPFGLKIFFFVLSVLGTICSGVILYAFAKAIDVYWVSVSYAVANFVLQSAFWLGLIWRMDPFRMPHWFCVTQTFIFGLGTFVLTGVCTCFSVATAMAVFRPSQVRDFSTLRWRNIYYLFMVVFPAVAATALITVILKLDAVHPTDDLHCDASHPIWVRFLGYAGVSLLLCIPSFFMTTVAAWRLFQASRLISSSQFPSGTSTLANVSFRSNVGTDSEFVLDARKPTDLSMPQIINTPATLNAFPNKSRLATAAASPHQGYHLPFKFNSANGSKPDSFPVKYSIPELDLVNNNKKDGSSRKISIVSVTRGPLDETDQYSTNNFPQKKADENNDDAEYGNARSMEWTAKVDNYSSRISVGSALSKLDSDCPGAGINSKGLGLGENIQLNDVKKRATPSLKKRISRTTVWSSKPRSSFAHAIWRLLFFQVAFFLVECLASLSTIIDVAMQRSKPTPFGTQHVALILAAWGPFFVFSHLPAVVKVMLGWFK